ncbi:VOC family protein [Agrobacterium vitis]|uniref:VOC family protein n=1 Tax=Allorhizobium ampelinum TaxID=3025782 RepID=UPI001F41EAD4|nr:VOC family protein [Allorhizobium ampelinum]MCF1462123.1 VOC family protein [Allorhizobium ampelinum]
MSAPILRVARPTDSIEGLRPFYQSGLGFEEIASFRDHNGFNGVMFGHKRWPYHLEFTHHIGHSVGRAPTQDNLLVFYLPEEEAWQSAVNRMRDAGFRPVTSYNPYWDNLGRTYEDPDGYRVVLQNSAWAL